MPKLFQKNLASPQPTTGNSFGQCYCRHISQLISTRNQREVWDFISRQKITRSCKPLFTIG